MDQYGSKFKDIDLLLIERSLIDLEQSAISAFPDTEKRQNSINNVRVSHQSYERPDTDKLLVTAKMDGESNNYVTKLLFSDVQYVPPGTDGAIDIGATEYILPLSSDTECKVSCTCLDFYYTFAWYDYNKDALIGKPPKPYQKVPGSNRPPRNPSNAPGICKHVMKLAADIKAQGILKK